MLWTDVGESTLFFFFSGAMLEDELALFLEILSGEAMPITNDEAKEQSDDNGDESESEGEAKRQ